MPVTVTVIHVMVTVPFIVTVTVTVFIVIHITDITMLPLVELPVQTQQILATWQTLKASNVLKTAHPTTSQAVTDTVTLLEMLTAAPDQAPQVATLTNELANATHQVEALTNELANSETAMNMLRAELTEAKQIAAALARATPNGVVGTGIYFCCFRTALIHRDLLRSYIWYSQAKEDRLTKRS